MPDRIETVVSGTTSIREEGKRMKVNTTKTVKEGLTDRAIDWIASQSGNKLKQAEKVRVRIPKMPGEDEVVECCINGYVFVIQRGQTMELPSPVVDLLATAGIV